MEQLALDASSTWLTPVVGLSAVAAAGVLAIVALVLAVRSSRASATHRQLGMQVEELQRERSSFAAESGSLINENETLRRERETSKRDHEILRAERDALRDDLALFKTKLSGMKHADVVSFLAMLQAKGRFLDFLMDDITKYPDAQIGAAARVVHQGCASVVKDYFDIAPVCGEAQEGSPLTLERDYDSGRFRLLGRVAGEPPFKGRLLHRGWMTTDVRLPELTGDAPVKQGIIAPAEVELH